MRLLRSPIWFFAFVGLSATFVFHILADGETTQWIIDHPFFPATTVGLIGIALSMLRWYLDREDRRRK